jgi:hypothetical protein
MAEFDFISIKNINIDLFRSFGATPEEVLANVLKEAGLLRQDTSINDIEATQLCNAFLAKKGNLKQSTQLGNILVKNRIITLQQLKDALLEQKKNPALKLGNVLISMGACTKLDIERCIRSQSQIREDLEALDSYQDKISSIRHRLSNH